MGLKINAFSDPTLKDLCSRICILGADKAGVLEELRLQKILIEGQYRYSVLSLLVEAGFLPDIWTEHLVDLNEGKVRLQTSDNDFVFLAKISDVAGLKELMDQQNEDLYQDLKTIFDTICAEMSLLWDKVKARLIELGHATSMTQEWSICDGMVIIPKKNPMDFLKQMLGNFANEDEGESLQ